MFYILTITFDREKKAALLQKIALVSYRKANPKRSQKTDLMHRLKK